MGLIEKIFYIGMFGLILTVLVGIITDFEYIILNYIMAVIAGLSIFSFIIILLFKIST